MTQMIVVGGGAIGMLMSLELARSGCSVTLIERGETGRESSWAGGGIISPLFPWRYLDSITRLASWSQDVYPGFCAELADRTGTDPEYTRSGLILIAPEEQSVASDWATRHRRSLTVVDAETFGRLEPAAARPAAEAFWMEDVAQVRNPRLVKALRTRLEQLGIDIRTGLRASGLVVEKSRCSGVRTDAGAIHGAAVIVCTGAWTGQLLQDLPSPPDVRPIRGQMLLFGATPGSISRMVLEGNRYVIPRRDGRTLFGSTIEDVGFEKITTRAARDELHAIATERFPVLRDCPVETHWAGLRPAAPAGVPYIGVHPEIDGLYVNAGHFRNGLVLGPASARLAADLVLDRDPIIDPTPYGWTAARG